MDPANKKAVRLLAEIAREPRPTGPVALGEEYLRRVERVESLARNRSGTDKTWVEQALRQFRAHYARAQRIS